ncbi:hypothetical protein ACP70R_019487 [Stipagrostis hirtigluma subsp. patula]
MVWEAGSSSNARQRGSTNLPLIICPCCKWRRVMELKATTDWNYGKIFYTCPNHKRDGSGCKFWFWQADYIEYLQSVGKLGATGEGVKEAVEETNPAGGVRQVEQRNRRSVASPEAAGEELREQLSALVAILVAILGVGKEVVWLLKAIVGVCVLVLFGIVLSICLQLKN